MKIAYFHGWIGKDQYLRILNIHKYNGILTCEICKEPINNNNDNRAYSRDHINPVCKGGMGTIENLRVTHRKCNSDRIVK
ncbi:MAG: HNH endonuclease signature motif containing protein [Patescibacteria group bacterium]